MTGCHARGLHSAHLLIRGALDARLHPQLAGSTRERTERSTSMSDRLPGFAAIGGGLLFLVGMAIIGLAPFSAVDGSRQIELAELAIAPGLALVDVALVAASVRRRGGAWGSVDTWLVIVAVVAALLFLTGWPGILIGFLAIVTTTLVVVARYLRRASAPPWIIAGAVVAIALSFLANSEDERIWLLAPAGVLAVAFGLLIAIRPRSAASVDPA